MRTLVYLAIILLSTSNLGAQNDPLARYVELGLANNIVLQQNKLTLQQSQHALSVARGMFLPEVMLDARYSLAQGGRVIEFPVGDLLNPVYSTLNDLLQSQGQNGGFPTINNEEINFLRPQEYNASITIVQPIYSRSLTLNKNIAETKLSMSETELELYKRELVFQIKEAYYNYMKTIQMIDFIHRTEEVVNENLRVTTRLFENNMTGKDAVLRARSEVSRVALMESSLAKSMETAKYYFNFLINRTLDESIETGSNMGVPYLLEEAELLENALEKREEINMIQAQSELLGYVADLSTAEMLPQVALALESGLQGEELKTINGSEYILGSLVFNWTLFKGNINRNKRQQALLEKEKAGLQQIEIQNRIKLEVKKDYLTYAEQKKNLELARNRNKEAAEVYRIVQKRYNQGEAALIELLDARNNMVEAESDVINTEYNLFISIARLEKSTHTGLIR